jgi:hypothetical protein
MGNSRGIGWMWDGGMCFFLSFRGSFVMISAYPQGSGLVQQDVAQPVICLNYKKSRLVVEIGVWARYFVGSVRFDSGGFNPVSQP